MLFLNQFKNLLVSFIRNDFSMEAWNNSPEQNPQTEKPSFEDSLRKVLEDKTLNWNDLAELESLNEQYLEDKTEIFKESREWFKSVIVDMLQNGYTVNNENDYNALKNIISIVDVKLNIPNYQDMLSNLPEDNREKFSFVLNDNKKRLLVYVMDWSDSTDDYWFIDLSNWSFNDSTWNWDFIKSFDDDIDNNNEISLDDIAYSGTEQYWRWNRRVNKSLETILNNESDELKSSELRELITSSWYIKSSPEWFSIDAPSIPENIWEMGLEDLEEFKTDIDFYNEKVIEHLDWIKKRELITELDNLQINNNIPEWFKYEWGTPTKPENLSNMNIEQLEWLISLIEDYNSSVVKFVEEQQRQQEEERRQQEAAEWQALNKAKRFYERVWATNDSIKELQALVGLEGDSIDGKFWPQTFRAIREKQTELWITSDGMAWKATLEKLNIEKSVQEFYSYNSEEKEESFVDSAWETISEWFSAAADAVSEWFKTVKEWISEVFNTNQDLLDFKWANWREITLEFEEWDENTPAQIHVDTPFFDWVSDFPLSDLPDNLTSYEDALTYVQAKVDSIKQEYDNQYLDNAINMVSSGRGSWYTLSSFESSSWEELDVKFYQKKDHDQKFDWAYVQVNTPWWDDISDRDTRVNLLDSNWGELTREQVMQAVDEAKAKYEEKYREVQENKQNENND